MNLNVLCEIWWRFKFKFSLRLCSFNVCPQINFALRMQSRRRSSGHISSNNAFKLSMYLATMENGKKRNEVDTENLRIPTVRSRNAISWYLDQFNSSDADRIWQGEERTTSPFILNMIKSRMRRQKWHKRDACVHRRRKFCKQKFIVAIAAVCGWGTRGGRGACENLLHNIILHLQVPHHHPPQFINQYVQ